MNNLISYERNCHQKDPIEQCGNLSLGLLIVGFGRNVKITATPAGEIYLTTSYSIQARITAIALSVILLPLTAFGAALGLLAYANSTSRKEIQAKYLKAEKNENQRKESLRLIQGEPSQKYNDLLAKHIHGYSLVEPNETVQEALTELKTAIEQSLNRKECFGPDLNLIDAKTRYLKRVDIEKQHPNAIPNPPLEIPFSSKEEIEKLNLPVATEPIPHFPELLYKHHHPRDSEEGSSFNMIGIFTKDPKWGCALKEAEKNSSLKNLTGSELFQLLFSLHTKITGRDEEVRNQFIAITNPNKCGSNFTDFKQYLKGVQDGESLIKRLNRIEQKAYRWGNIENGAPYFTPKQWAAFSSVAFIPPSPEGLKEKAEVFLNKAVAVMNRTDLHPMQIAAYLHHGLTALHLFEDGNGRLSRLIANIYLMQNGFQPFYVVRDEMYTSINSEKVYDIAFCQFLVENNKLMEQVESIPQDGGCHVQ